MQNGDLFTQTELCAELAPFRQEIKDILIVLVSMEQINVKVCVLSK
jgi:hypothetical protein